MLIREGRRREGSEEERKDGGKARMKKEGKKESDSSLQIEIINK